MLRVARPESERLLEGITVERAATILGCDQSTVRKLIKCQAIEGWKVGKSDEDPGGVRCDLQSVVDYRRRHAIGGDRHEVALRKKRRPKPSNAAHREAISEARALGIRLLPTG